MTRSHSVVPLGRARERPTLPGAVVPSRPLAEPEQDPVAEMQAQEAERDLEQIESLTEQAQRIHDGLLPVLDGLVTTLPVGEAAPAAMATREQVVSWQAVTKGFVDEFAERPSAGTGVNIARSGLAASLQQRDSAIATYAQALAAPDRESWLRASGRQRDLAIVTWSVAATQLDLLNVDAGQGHRHIFLPSRPGQGALAPDSAPEGTG
jgi:hypothetical protein